MRTPEQGESWGILGGTFDPVHLGHINLARQIYKIKKLHGVLLIPTWNHPVKAGDVFASFDDRLAMLRLAVDSDAGLYVSTMERDRELSGYTIDTIRTLKALYPGGEFYFIIGSDNISQLENWYHPEEIVREVKIIAGTRPGADVSVIKSRYDEFVEYVEIEPREASSSEIRRQVRGGIP